MPTQVKNEIVLQGALQHRHIVQLLDIVVQPQVDQVAIIMELCDGDLFQKVLEKDGCSEVEALGYFRQMMLGVVYCHSRYIVHRDLKLENLMLQRVDNELVLKIGDFGFAKNVAPSRVRKWKYYQGAHRTVASVLIYCSGPQLS